MSNKALAFSAAVVGMVVAGVALDNPAWWAVGLLLAAAFFGHKIQKVYFNYFGQPQGHALRRADLSDLTGPTLGHYYVHADGKNIATVRAGVYCQPPFDENGIPLVDYGPGIGKQHNPCTVAQYALEHWESFLRTGNEGHRDVFLKQADWLVENQHEGKWYYRFELKKRRLSSPWISGMAQGQGMSVLLRAWQCSGNEVYRRAAERAFAAFEVPIEGGGVALKTEAGTWFEEYPTLPMPDHVMNGHIWALFGIWDLHRATRSPAALRLFRDGIAVFEASLAQYDTGYWVWYDLGPRSFLVDSYYMHFQIDQIRVLCAITGSSLLDEYLRRWQGYQRSLRSVCRVTLHTLGWAH